MPRHIFPTFLAGLSVLAPLPAAAQESADVAALRAEIVRMRAELQQLEARLGTIEQNSAAKAGPPAAPSAQAATTEPSAGPAPVSGPVPAPVQVASAPPAPMPAAAAPPPAAPSFPTFKPRGRLQLDTNYVTRPDGISAPTLGWSSDVRRAYLGAEGKFGANFGYRLEVDFASGDAVFTDAFLTYGAGPLTFTVGQHKLATMDEMTSDLELTLLERASFTQAFGFERRLGVSAIYSRGDVNISAGAFSDDLATLGSGITDNSYTLDTRFIYMPQLGKTQLHFGGSLHYRDLNDLATDLRYRSRPGARTTDMRFVDTGTFSATAETGYGLEFAAGLGKLHVAAEGFWQHVSRPGLPNPTFFGGYGEVGYIIAGAERRSYRDGAFGAVTPIKGLDKGGSGAWEVNLRYDWLDLTSTGVVGGKQRIVGTSLIWVPIAHVKFMANYLHINVIDTPIVANGDDTYAVDVIGMRAQYDF